MNVLDVDTNKFYAKYLYKPTFDMFGNILEPEETSFILSILKFSNLKINDAITFNYIDFNVSDNYSYSVCNNAMVSEKFFKLFKEFDINNLDIENKNKILNICDNLMFL